MDDASWATVDDYLIETLIAEDDALVEARISTQWTAMPGADVAPNQGAFLALIARIAGARRILEFGTSAGYSTIWLARAVGPSGSVVTMEVDPETARVARGNFERAGVADRIEQLVGPAAHWIGRLVEGGTAAFDLVFIDADKPSNPVYLEGALALSRPGTVIITDNVVRGGAVADATSTDPRVQGTRRLLEMLRDDPRLEATALQTVGLKGWDGFAIAVVGDPSAAAAETEV